MAKWPPDDETTEPNADGTPKTETLQTKKDRLAAFLSALAAGGGGKKLQTQIENLQLEIRTLELHQPAPDNISGALGGHGPSPDSGAPYDQLTSLSVDAQILMLRENNIHVTPATGGRGLGAGTMAALVLRNALKPADRRAVRFNKVELQTPTTVRYDNSGISHGEFESNLQRHAVTESDLSIGIPGLFQVDGTYSASSAIASYEKKVKIYFQSSQLISKAKVVVDEISLAPEFVTKITEVCNTGTGLDRAEKLLSCLSEYGQFVPTSIMVGGRITLHTSKELNDRSDTEATEEQLKLAAAAKFRATGAPPVDGGAKGGKKKSMTSTVSTVDQTGELKFVLKGGKEAMASTHAATLGTHWIPTLGPSIAWRTIGYSDQSLIPIITLLPGDLPEKCKDILRYYFKCNLDLKDTDLLGPEGDDAYPDQNDAARKIDFSRVRRITDITVNHGRDLNGLQWSYELYTVDGSGWSHERTGRYIGAHQGAENGMPIRLKHDEVITGVRAGWDSNTDRGMLRRIAFITNRNRYPNADETYYGQGNVNKYRTIEAPRVRGMFGWKKTFVQSIGLKYLALSPDTKSREFLLAMEPLLFRQHDYGIVS